MKPAGDGTWGNPGRSLTCAPTITADVSTITGLIR